MLSLELLLSSCLLGGAGVRRSGGGRGGGGGAPWHTGTDFPSTVSMPSRKYYTLTTISVDITVDRKLSLLKRDCKKFEEFLLIDCKILSL